VGSQGTSELGLSATMTPKSEKLQASHYISTSIDSYCLLYTTAQHWLRPFPGGHIYAPLSPYLFVLCCVVLCCVVLCCVVLCCMAIRSLRLLKQL
jgi:hypothetical protein